MPLTLIDQQIAQKLSQSQQKIEQIRDQIQKLKELQEHNKAALKSAQKTKSLLIQQIIMNLEKTLFSRCNDSIRAIESTQNEVQKSLQLLQYQTKQLEKISQVQLRQVQIDLSFTKEKSLQQSLKQEQQRLQNIADQLILQFQALLEQFRIKESKSLDLQNTLGGIKESKSLDLQNILSVAINSQLKLNFNLSTQKFSKQEISIPVTFQDFTQVEQTADQKLIISGGNMGQNNYVLYDQGNIKKFQMNSQRALHRTVQVKDLNYIIAGRIDRDSINMCEVFNESQSIFQNIVNILIPVQSFGGCCLDETI